MRIIWIGLVVFLLAAVATAGETPFAISSGGKPVLALKLPEGAQAETTGDRTRIDTPKRELRLYIWTVAKAKAPKDAEKRVSDIIKSEFINLKVSSTKDIKIAGAPARLIAGPGTEADDGDPGNAEVVFFKVGGRVFAACVHGEGDAASRQHNAMMSVLETARKP